MLDEEKKNQRGREARDNYKSRARERILSPPIFPLFARVRFARIMTSTFESRGGGGGHLITRPFHRTNPNVRRHPTVFHAFLVSIMHPVNYVAWFFASVRSDYSSVEVLVNDFGGGKEMDSGVSLVSLFFLLLNFD